MLTFILGITTTFTVAYFAEGLIPLLRARKMKNQIEAHEAKKKVARKPDVDLMALKKALENENI